MDKKPEIGKNPDYRNKLGSLWSKSRKPSSNKVIEESESPEQANAPVRPETANNIKEIVAKRAVIAAQGLKKAVYTVAEQAAPVVAEATEKLKDTFIDRILPSEDPKDPPADGVAGSTQPNWDALILEETESKSSYFSSLLNLTDTFIASGQFSQEDAEQLVQKWEYAFKIGECVGISHKLAELRHDQDAKAQLAGIMQLFHHLGLKKLDVQNPVAVSPENRFYFDNGTQFPDGTVCEIARWPWLYKEKVYYRGMLRQLEDEQVL